MQAASQLNIYPQDQEPADCCVGPTEEREGNSPTYLSESERSRRLTSVLRAYTLPDTFSDAEAFRARVMLSVPRRKAAPPRHAPWAWYVVPVSLVCALVVGQGLLSLAGSVGLITGALRWGGGEILTQAESWLSEWASGSPLLETLGPSLPMLLYVVLQAAAALGLILVFLPYVGWVTVLWRTETRPVTLKGERNGTL